MFVEHINIIRTHWTSRCFYLSLWDISTPNPATRGSPLPAHFKKKTWKRSHFPVVNNCCFVCLDTFSYKNFKKKDSSNPNIPFKFSFLVCNDCVIDYTYLRRWRRLPAGKQSAWSIKRLLWEFINTPNNHWFTSSACTECRCFQTSLMEPSAPAWHFSLFLQQSLRPPWLLHVIRHLYTDQQSCCLWLVSSPLRKSKLWKKGYLVTRFLCSLLAASEDHTVA